MATKRPIQATVTLFERHALSGQVFTWQDLREKYDQFLNRYPLHRVHRFGSILAHLIQAGVVKELEIRPEKKSRGADRAPYKPFVRFSRPTATPMDVGVALRSGSYFSHGTAASIHGLVDSSDIYVNKEQTVKPLGEGVLTQQGINMAFSNAPRISQYVYTFEDRRIVLLSGKNTSDFEVIEKNEGLRLTRYTSLERTLFDIAVRPTYAGGIRSVLRAYQNAVDEVDIGKLLQVIKRVAHLYPYHQAIGFYLKRAGMSALDLRALRELGLEFDFYLGNQIKKPTFDNEWRIFFPGDL
jgi:hypothetical protein